jgi:hypothetical protein
MTKTTRTLLIALLGLIILIALGFALSHWHAIGEFPGTITIDDHDLSDSPYGWMIAIPILFLVGVMVTVICAGAAVFVVIALVFAALMVFLALLLAATPLLLLLGIPALAIYGFVKLIERDRKAAQA